MLQEALRLQIKAQVDTLKEMEGGHCLRQLPSSLFFF